MLKPNSWQSHDVYRAIVKTYGRRLSRSNPKYAFDQYEKQCQKLLNLSLDPVLGYISQFYSNTGRPAKNQAQILRSLILFVMLFNCTSAKTSLTAWVRDVLPSSISLMVLVGCTSVEELPPLGSYYDFMDRFWLAPHDVCSRASLLPAAALQHIFFVLAAIPNLEKTLKYIPQFTSYTQQGNSSDKILHSNNLNKSVQLLPPLSIYYTDLKLPFCPYRMI